jgi:TolB-like protein
VSSASWLLDRLDVSAQTTIVINDMIADLGSETLCFRNGGTIALRPQAFATLRYLITNANRLVTKNELIQAVWEGIAVTDDSLVQCVHEIRRALNDDAHDVLQTVTRRGYRLLLPERNNPNPVSGPSIAVLPFTNLSEVSAQDYFTDGLVEDVITSLSNIPGLFVIARNSSFAYRGRAMDVRSVADELGVRYLLAGSVRRSGNHLRISGQLIDGASAAHIWAGRFDGTAKDIFDLQDQFAAHVVGIIEPSVRRAEIERARRKRPDSLGAYDLYLRALPHALSNTITETGKAIQLLNDSLQLDPNYMPAHGYAAWCHEQRYFRNGFDPADREAALRHADIALGVNSDDPQALSIGAFVRANLTRDYDGAIEVLDRALAMNGNSALAFGFSSLVGAHSERHDRAVEHAQKALRLSPLDDPFNYHPYCALALTNLFAGHFTEAVTYATLTIQANPGFSVAYAYLVASYVNLGNLDAARGAARRLLEIAPAFSIADFARMDLFRAPLMEGITAALRKAGLPESRSLLG